jgi:hypothetical protein
MEVDGDGEHNPETVGLTGFARPRRGFLVGISQKL